MRKNKEKLLLSAVLVGVLGTLAGLSIFGAFTSTTTNPGNEFATGSVTIADNDTGTALYDLSNQKPGDSVTRCINVTYTGTLDADVRLYTPSTLGAVSQHVNLTIDVDTGGTVVFPSCVGFTADAGGPLFDGTLSGFASAHDSWANGLTTNPLAATSWAENDNVVYRFNVELDSNAPDTAQSSTTGQHSYTWEARNQ